MKKIFKKIKTQLTNSGSTLVLVVVALGFVGILTGALLTAVGYAYRQKLYDYNSKSNFYYLEQAMDEIYAGLGSQTMETMQEAYEETREEAVKYNTKTYEYENIGSENANTLFKDKFMKKLSSSSNYQLVRVPSTNAVDPSDGLAKTLASFISNKEGNGGTIKLVVDNLKVVYLFTDGTQSSSNVTSKSLAKIMIQNVTLTREAEYNRSNANGKFKQTISTDIEISRPDFDVAFDGSSSNINNLFEFCLVADSGVEINKTPGSILSVNGNVYAANDFYNKRYNNYSANETDTYKADVVWNRADGSSKKYSMAPVTSYAYSPSDTDPIQNTTLFNKNEYPSKVTDKIKALYDGNNLKSKYSGFYINGSDVNIFANKIIVPGTIAVMDAGSLTVYGVEGTSVTQSNVWADELILDGSTQGAIETSGSVISEIKNEKGSKADLTANLYIKDDTQIEADYSRFRLNGSYYGFGNGTEQDSRKFIPTTLINESDGKNIYQVAVDPKDSTKGNKVRAHYTSSAIIVNGQHANVNLLDTKSIYLAGRSYIELSKINNGPTNTSYVKVKKDDGNFVGNKVTSTSFTYDSDIDDYKTGESLAIKSSQLAYKPDKSPIAEYFVKSNANDSKYTVSKTEAEINSALATNPNYDYKTEYFSELPEALKNMVLFTKYFNTADVTKGGKVPVIYIEDQYTKSDGTTTATKYYYYLDFEYAYEYDLFNTNVFTKNQNDTSGKIKISSADDLSSAFITDYFNYVNYVVKYNDLGVNAVPSDLQDKNILSNKNEVDINGSTVKRLDVLASVTKYEDYFAGAIATPNNGSGSANKIYSSGAVTQSLDKNQSKLDKTKLKACLTSDKDVTFGIQTSTNQQILSTVLGETEDSISDKKVTNAASTLAFSAEYEKHYNYLKWSLQDLPTAVSTKDGVWTESQFVDKLFNDKSSSYYKGTESITPLNNYFNFKNISNTDADFANSATNISPANLKLSPVTNGGSYDYSEYKVYVSNEDVHLSCESANEHGSITGIVITKGDVYFDEYSGTDSYKTVKDFNGIIISGGKVYVNNSITNISSSDLCKTIMNQCTVKAQDVTSSDVAKKKEALMAVKVLELFKDYEDVGEKYRDIYNNPSHATAANSEQFKNITSIDYSDVLRYNNWMKNVD